MAKKSLSLKLARTELSGTPASIEIDKIEDEIKKAVRKFSILTEKILTKI